MAFEIYACSSRGLRRFVRCRSAVVAAFLAIGVGAMVLWLPVEAVRADQPDAEPAAHRGEKGEMKIVRGEEVQWKPGPESLPQGVQFAVLEGDPSKSGPFTMRLKVPANYRIPPHTHPKVERVTVLSGTFRLGMGRQFSEAGMQELPAGSFFTMPIGMEHFAMTTEPTIVQLNGVGPWDIRYLNPDDDPRKKKQ